MTNLEALHLLHCAQRNVQRVDQAIDILELKGNNMALDPTVAKVIKDLDAATDKVALRIQKVIDDAAAAGSLSAAEVAAALQPEVDRLNLLGQDPNDPVPSAAA